MANVIERIWKGLRVLFGTSNPPQTPAENKTQWQRFASAVGGVFGGRPKSRQSSALAYSVPNVPINGFHEYINQIDNLAIFAHDISRATNNVIDFGNTPIAITFPTASPRQVVKMLAHLDMREKQWLKNDNRISFISSLFRQVQVGGALSYEVVPAMNMRGIERVVLVEPSRLYFQLEGLDYAPYQLAPVGSLQVGYIRLNTEQYKYVPLIKHSKTPYGIPPLIATLGVYDIQVPMEQNVAEMTRKWGLLGFLTALIEKPEPYAERRPDGTTYVTESETSYRTRLSDLLNTAGKELENGVNNGVVTGFKGETEFSIEANKTNASNASEIFATVDKWFAAASGQSPSLLGREDHVVSETFGKVILAQFATKVQTAQALVADALADIYLTELRLAGFNVDKVSVKFDAPVMKDAAIEVEIMGKRIDNLIKLIQAGIITPEDAAAELGRTVSKRGAPVSLQANQTEVSCGTDWGDKKTQRIADNYIGDVNKLYNKAVAKASKAMRAEARALPAAPAYSDLMRLMDSFFKEFDAVFTDALPDTCNPHVESAYNFYRGDKRIFPAKTSTANAAFVTPEPVLSLADQRAIKWLQGHDVFFLSKFIRDADTVARILRFISDYYLENGEAIGDNDKVLNEFIKQFAGVLNEEIWQIRRVLDTSVSKIRTFAHVSYMKQASVANFKVVEVMDSITCAHCKSMNGRTFSVAKEIDKINMVVSTSDYSTINKVSPFATSIPITDLESLSDEQVQARGIGGAPYHPSCRGTVVAIT